MKVTRSDESGLLEQRKDQGHRSGNVHIRNYRLSHRRTSTFHQEIVTKVWQSEIVTKVSQHCFPSG
jgi:hypothetical protein